MKFDSSTKTRVYADMTLSIDPAGSTVEVWVESSDEDGDTSDWYAATWQGTAVAGTDAQGRAQWTQTALTAGYFAGPDVAVPGSAVVLATGRHLTQTRITSGSTVLVHNSTPIDVKA
jgi:hypothetical protein